MLLDLSHAITEGMITYPGLEGPQLSEVLDRATSEERFPGIRMSIGHVCMVANTGTYVDVPFHYYEDGDDLASFGLHRVAQLPGLYVDVRQALERGIGAEAFDNVDVSGRAVLLHTGWDRHFGTAAYGVDAPFVTAAGIRHLIDHNAALVGIDSVNIDDIGDLQRPAHVGLLAAGIPIVEHLVGLEQLSGIAAFAFTAAPPKFTALGTFPVRAFASTD